MGRPPIGSRPLTKTERQRRWRQRKRLAPVTEPSHQSAGDAKPDPFVIRPKPAAVSDHGKYAAIISQVLEFADGLPQPQCHLLEVIQRLQCEYRQRQAVEVGPAPKGSQGRAPRGFRRSPRGQAGQGSPVPPSLENPS